MDLTQIYDNLVGASEEEKRRRNIFDVNDVTNYSNNNIVADVVKQDLNRQWSVPRKEAERYERFGVYYNPKDAVSGLLDIKLAENQSGFSKVKNALIQTVADEIALGTVKGVFDLFDMVGNAVTKGDNDYQNPITVALEQAQEAVRNWAPINVKPGVSIDNGGLLDIGWWASNVPSVASSLTLLIPSTGLVKGAGLLSRAIVGGGDIAKGARKISAFSRKSTRALTGATKSLRRGEKLNDFQLWANKASTRTKFGLLRESAMSASLQRAMENYQESRQTYDDSYEQNLEVLNNMNDEDYNTYINSHQDLFKDVDTSNKDAVAKRIASKAADRTFAIDWTNVVFDVIQLYALRNAWKGFTTKANPNSAMRQMNKEAAANFGKKAEEVAEQSARFAALKKAGKWVGNKLYDSNKVVLAELSEGAEEAINYIAQQEGMHYGNVLIEKEPASIFDTRLHDYINAPELHDAAFWGVIGGVVFQNIGSKFKRLQTTMERKNAEKDNKTNKEAAKDTPFYQLDDTIETQRIKSDIENRTISSQEFFKNLDKIKSGIDIYASTDENTVTFDNDLEKEAAMERLFDEYLSNLTIRSINAGTLDMLKSFFADDNVRKGFIEQGMAIEEDSKEFIDKVLNKIDKIENDYNNELIALDNASASIEGYVPMEYLQILAFKNVDFNRRREVLSNEDIKVRGRINTLKDQFKDKLKTEFEGIDLDRNAKIDALTHQLGKLRANRKYLLSKDKDREDLSTDISIRTIDKQIAEIESQLSDEELVYATFQSLRYETQDGKLFAQTNNSSAFAYRDKMITNRLGQTVGTVQTIPGIDYVADRNKTALSDDTVERYKKLEKQINIQNSKLKEISPELQRMIDISANIKLASDIYKSQIAQTVPEIEEKIMELHNSMDETRTEAIKIAKRNIADLYKEYGKEIKDVINDVYNGTSLEDIDTNLSLNERNKLFESLKVLDLTKSYNKGLINGLIDTFNSIDAIEAAIKKNSSINSDEILGTESEKIDNSSTDNQKSENEPKTNEILNLDGEKTKQNEPKTEKEKSKPYVLIPTNNGDNTYNFSINPKNEDAVSYLNDNNYYDKEEDASLLDDIEITQMPVVRRDEKGNLIIVSKGRIAKKTQQTTEEAQTAQSAAEAKANISQEPVANIPLKGEVESTQSDDAVLIGADYTNDIYDESFSKFMDAISNQLDVDLDVVAEHIKQEYIKSGLKENQLGDINLAKEDAENLRKEITNELQSSVLELIKNRKDFNSKEYQDAASRIIEEYAKYAGLEKTDSKYYFSLEDALRFINESFKQHRIGDNIYWSLKEYLLGKYNNNFILTDAGEVNDKDFLENVHKSRAERYKDRLNGANIHQVDILSYLKYISKDSNREQLAKEFNEALTHLGVGTILTPTIEGNHIYFKDSEGRVAATIPIPDEEIQDEYGKTGRFTIMNEGWITDVLIVNNNIDSKLKDFFEGILTSDSSAAKELNKILFKHAFGKKSDVEKDYDTDFEGFKKNDIIRNAFNQYLIKHEDDDSRQNDRFEEAFNHLIKLWKFVHTSKVNPNKRDNILIKQSLNDWFEKINNSYNFAKMLEANPSSGKIVVSNIRGRQIIRVVDKVTDAAKELPYVGKAIGKNVKPGSVKIAAADNKKAGSTKISGVGTITTTAIGAANTFIMIYDEAGTPYGVQAYPITMSDVDSKAKDIKDILNAIYTEANSLVSEFDKNSTQENYDKLKQFFIKCFTSNKGNSSPFYNIYVYDTGNTFKIGLNGNKNVFVRFGFNNGNKSIQVNSPDSSKTTFRSLFEDMLNQLRTNISYSYIESDSHADYTLNGIASKKNGKFAIEVGKVKKEYNSFNEFIIKNNLIRVNTKPNAIGTNFVLIDSSNANTVRVSVQYEDSSSPIEKNEVVQTPFTTATGNTREQVINILNDTSIEHKGNAILNAAILSMTDAAKEELKNVSGLNLTTKEISRLSNLSLLPKTIIFDPEFNNRAGYSEVNAEYSPSKNTVTIGERWMQLWSNPQTRDIAIKKLIHEELHSKLVRNKGYVRNAKNIFDEFKEFINSVQDNERYKAWRDSLGITKEKADEHFKSYFFEDKSELDGLEEFLVESLTNGDVVAILNAIDAKDYKGSKSKNLFQAILELLSKIFNWNVREGSLYEKELNTLRSVFRQPNIKKDTSGQLDLFKDNIEQEEKPSVKEEYITKSDDNKSDEDEANEASNIRNKLKNKVDRKKRGIYSDRTEISVQPYSEEMQDIKSKAIADGTFIKAPNGNPTNLTERQWLQVRTKGFKDWFGDWETIAKLNKVSLGKTIPNTDKYSKYGQKGETDIEIREVLDENGKLIGTVRMEFSGKDRNGVVTLHPQLSVTGKGYGTAIYQHIADTYGIPVEESFGEIGKSEAGKALWNKLQRDNNTQISKGDIPLRQLLPTNASKVIDENGEPLVVYHGTNIENISIFDRTQIPEEQTLVGTGTATFGNFFSDKQYDAKSFAGVIKLRRKSGKATVYDTFLNIKNPIYFETLGDFRNYSYKEGHYNENGDFVSDVKLPKEYDGVIVKRRNSSDDAKEFVAPNPNQIKSATDNIGTFSKEDNNIYHSDRIELTAKLTIEEFIEDIPFENRQNVRSLIKNGNINVLCK